MFADYANKAVNNLGTGALTLGGSLILNGKSNTTTTRTFASTAISGNANAILTATSNGTGSLGATLNATDARRAEHG